MGLFNVFNKKKNTPIGKYRRVIGLHLSDDNHLIVKTVDQDGVKRIVAFPVDSNDSNIRRAIDKFEEWFDEAISDKYYWQYTCCSYTYGDFNKDNAFMDDGGEDLGSYVWEKNKMFVECSEDEWLDMILCDGDINDIYEGNITDKAKINEILNRDLSEWRLSEKVCA